MPDNPLIKWNNNFCNCWTMTDRQCNIFKCKQKIWHRRFSELSVQCYYSTIPLSMLTPMSLLVINNDTHDLWPHVECEKHKKGDTGETSLAKVTNFFTASGFQSDDAVLAAEGAAAFSTMKRHTSCKTEDCTSVSFHFIYLEFQRSTKVDIELVKYNTVVTEKESLQ